MFLIQKRKSKNSAWHTVKEFGGKKIVSDDLSDIIGCVNQLRMKQSHYEFRVIDNVTGNVAVCF